MNGKKNIFIVDDVQENLQVLGNMLRERGYNISFARNGDHALKGVEKRKPDLILMDISMPGMNGYEACEKLKEKEGTRDIPLIFLTARSELEDVVKGFRLGAVDYVTKPFNREELLARVNTHLELKEARDTITRQLRELEEKNEALYISSITDRLTGVYNRLYILETLSREFSKSKRQKTPCSCLMMDIDFFKKVNDTYGHGAGDLVLKETARLVGSLVRNEDVFGRYGGEEFLLILPDTPLSDSGKTGEKIRRAVENQIIDFEGNELKVTMSMGLAEAGAHNPESVEKLVDYADRALYQAKRKGRNRLALFEGA